MGVNRVNSTRVTSVVLIHTQVLLATRGSLRDTFTEKLVFSRSISGMSMTCSDTNSKHFAEFFVLEDLLGCQHGQECSKMLSLTPFDPLDKVEI